MKIEIEDYKGHTIYYNDDSDKFECAIEINGEVKNSKRGSLQDLRKEIDQFIKLNLDFKPFKFLYRPYDTFSLYHCEAIRTDGQFVVSAQNGYYKSYFGKKESRAMMQMDEVVYNRLLEINKELDDFNQKCNAEIEELSKSLVPLDLSKYDLK